MTNSDARLIVLKMLDKTISNKGFSNIILDSELSKAPLSDRDKRFCSALYYGVIERMLTLDFIIGNYSSKKLNKLDTGVVNILRMGLYQLIYMDSVLDSAAINECVGLTRKIKLSSASGFVNAVLRSFVRDGKAIRFPKNKTEKLSVEYSVPVYLIHKLTDEYGLDAALSLVKNAVSVPPVTARMNTLLCDEQTLIENLDGISAEKNKFVPNAYNLSGGDVTRTTAYQKGFFHVQDVSSQLCCMALSPSENDTVLDLCAAPGGKSFTIAQLMNGKGSVYSFDLHEKRTKLIADGASRLHLGNIKTAAGDASSYSLDMPAADKILCDVPCSGLGVIRRKPEIKYKSPDEFLKLPEIQYGILENAAKYLKKNGELVYSTCTLSKAENDEVIDRFLANHSEFSGIPFLEEYGQPFGSYKATLFPMHFDCDGFFISKIKRTGD